MSTHGSIDAKTPVMTLHSQLIMLHLLLNCSEIVLMILPAKIAGTD